MVFEHRFKRLSAKVLLFARRVTLPGFQGVPIYDVARLFIDSMKNGAVHTRASSVAFHFILAIFPAILFFFTLIPYIPIDNFQSELLILIEEVVPHNLYFSIENTIKEIVLQPNGGLLSTGVLFALFFSSNGAMALIRAFNASTHSIENRTMIEQRKKSFIITIVLFFSITLSIVLIMLTNTTIQYLQSIDLLKGAWSVFLIKSARWFVVIFALFTLFSVVFKVAPAKSSEWRFISPGGTLATVLSILATYAFKVYIEGFGQYNTLYGSIGTLPVMMLLVFINSFAIIICYEINASIGAAKRDYSEMNFFHRFQKKQKK